jgi:hypothetical protein
MISIFLFYSKARGKQTWWVRNKEFLHCHAITTRTGKEYILTELKTDEIDFHVVPTQSPDRILRNIKHLPNLSAYIAVYIDHPKRVRWFPLWVRSCNEFIRHLSGIDIGYTQSPYHLYKKLLKYNEKANFTILAHWRRSWPVIMTTVQPTTQIDY